MEGHCVQQFIATLETKAGNFFFYRTSLGIISSTGELLIDGRRYELENIAYTKYVYHGSVLYVKILFHSGEKLGLRLFDDAAKLVTNKGLGNFANTEEMNFAATLGRFLGKVTTPPEKLITFGEFIEEFKSELEQRKKPQEGFDDMHTIEQYLLGRLHFEEEEVLSWLPGLIRIKEDK